MRCNKCYTFNFFYSFIIMAKLIIVSAPSGSGKSTIIQSLMEHEELRLAFSVSCTSRAPRGEERDGVDYFFITPEEFRERIERGEFLEYEEVYENRFYGTLKQQVEHRWNGSWKTDRMWCLMSMSKAGAT